MRYPNIHRAAFIERPNRFVARCLLEGEPITVHVKNTGRCRELLVPGAEVWLTKSDNPARKTAFDLIAVQKGPRLINMDSNAPNTAFGEYVRAGKFLSDAQKIRSEVRWGDSRFDFCLESGGKTHYIEVKGVTLEENGAVRFPDAPTERGVKHLRELQRAAAEGCGAHAVFVIQMKDVTQFSPNDDTHPAFGAALREAAKNGVQVHAFWCEVTPDTMEIAGSVKICL